MTCFRRHITPRRYFHADILPRCFRAAAKRADTPLPRYDAASAQDAAMPLLEIDMSPPPAMIYIFTRRYCRQLIFFFSLDYAAPIRYLMSMSLPRHADSRQSRVIWFTPPQLFLRYVLIVTPQR